MRGCLIGLVRPGDTTVLISVHLPKTAGVSFANTLEDVFANRLLRDYADLPLHSGNWQRNTSALKQCLKNARAGAFADPFASVSCIHGHFMPLKYRFLSGGSDNRFVVWLRDPVERVASHYYYWLREYDAQYAGPLQRRVVEEKWSLERFCLGPELQNVYRKFFWGFPFSRFDFVGITEHYEEDLARFGREFLESKPVGSVDNINPEQKSAGYFEDAEQRQRVEQHHAWDVALYRRALAMRASGLRG